MKCIICKSSSIKKKKIEEEIKSGDDIILIPMEVLVCQSCSERYYDSKTMRKLEDIRARLRKHNLETEAIGKVLRAEVT